MCACVRAGVRACVRVCNPMCVVKCRTIDSLHISSSGSLA